MSNLIRYFLVVRSRWESWADRHVFAPHWTNASAAVRLSLSMACLLVFTTWIGDLPVWTAADGPLSREVTGFLIGDGLANSGADFRISPLYYTDRHLWTAGYVLIGVIASLIAMSGLGGRWSAAFLCIWVLGLIHRIAPIQTNGEILVSTFLPYLVIDQGWLAHPSRVGFSDDQRRWTVRLMLTLMRCHLAIWVAVTLAFHLSQNMWWDGSAGSTIASRLEKSLDQPNGLTSQHVLSTVWANIWLLIQIAAIAVLCLPRAAIAATAVLGCYWFCGWLWSGDWLYALAGLAVSSFLYFDASLEWGALKRGGATGGPGALSTH